MDANIHDTQSHLDEIIEAFITIEEYANGEPGRSREDFIEMVGRILVWTDSGLRAAELLTDVLDKIILEKE